MTDAELETHYRQYIRCLNERRLDDLGHYVHDKLRYNGVSETRMAYRDRLIQDVAAIPDLYFDVHLLVAHDQTVGCRIFFRCTPQHEWQGWHPDGQTISFAEHVFYRFRDGKIEEVWSLLDRDAIAEQLS
jgi:predicted ester cyclase